MLGQQIHQHDREEHAKRLSLSLEEFDRLVASANHAYEVIRNLGPFYGKEENKEPTFRTTAEPVVLPKKAKETLTLLGQDLLHLAKALQKLPEKHKKELAEELDFRIPPTWRIDVILDNSGQLKVNEIEGQDGASALMIAEQLAYGAQTLAESTAAKLISTLKKMLVPQEKDLHRVAFVRVNNPHNTNADRFIDLLDTLSKGTLKLDHIDENTIIPGGVIPDWNKYAGAIVETSFPPKKLYELGLKEEKAISVGVHNAFVNKGVFALLFDNELEKFWEEHLEKERFMRLKEILIPSHFIRSVEDLENAKKQGKVVKASWAGENAHLVNRSRGVAIPEDSVKQGSEEQWTMLKDLLGQGVKMIAQDFVIPAKIPSYLLKKGITLEYVEWYNRICVKYVAEGNPNEDKIHPVALTATEVTLGPDIVPAGRSCAFTAGVFETEIS